MLFVFAVSVTYPLLKCQLAFREFNTHSSLHGNAATVVQYYFT